MTKLFREVSGPEPRVVLVLLLTLGTGAVDAVSYFSLNHVFTASMSANMAILGIGVATRLSAVAGNLFALAGFVAGSIGIGRLTRSRERRFHRTTALCLLAELVLLVPLTVISAMVSFAAASAWRYAACVVLAAAMAAQTGISRHLSVQDVNTTVATMTLHDLAAASRLGGGNSVRWKRRAAVVCAIIAGALIGVGLDNQARWAGLAFASAIVAAAFLAVALRS